MKPKNQPKRRYHYDYRKLDELLSDGYEPESVWLYLDESLYNLVEHQQDHPRIGFINRYNLLRDLRNILGTLKSAEPWKSLN